MRRLVLVHLHPVDAHVLLGAGRDDQPGLDTRIIQELCLADRVALVWVVSCRVE